MPKLTETDDWVSALRTFIRDTLGNKNWQIRKGEREDGNTWSKDYGFRK